MSITSRNSQILSGSHNSDVECDPFPFQGDPLNMSSQFQDIFTVDKKKQPKTVKQSSSQSSSSKPTGNYIFLLLN